MVSTAGMQALPQDYDAQTAAAKLDLLWKNITDTRCGGMPLMPWLCITLDIVRRNNKQAVALA
jgi:hypothetical protein